MRDLASRLNKIEVENEELRKYKRAVRKAVHKLIELDPDEDYDDVLQLKKNYSELKKEVENLKKFEQKIEAFYELKTDEDRQRFCDVMLNENSKNFWSQKR